MVIMFQRKRANVWHRISSNMAAGGAVGAKAAVKNERIRLCALATSAISGSSSKAQASKMDADKTGG